MSIRKTKRAGRRHKSDAMRFLNGIAGPLTLGSVLEATRKADGISQVQLAAKLGLSKAYLCDVEKGRKTVSAARAAEFARVLGESERQFVRLALQAQLDKAGLALEVKLNVA